MSQHANILIVDDEKNGRLMLEIILSKLGYQVTTAADGEEALNIFRGNSFDLVITDLQMPKLDGLGLLTALRQADIKIPVIILTAYGSVESAVTAMKNGAFDFISRPFNNEQIELVVKHALGLYRLQQENDFLRVQLDQNSDDELVGESSSMRQIYQLIQQVAPTPANVFITGETGTGKEVIANAIHKYSGRKGVFVPINCAALSSSIAESELFGHVRGAFTGADKDRIGKFEFAQYGTLFLDEITEMDPDLQAKLLRVLQERSIERVGSNRKIDIDIRIIAATNRDIREAIADGHLRNDLYYRLNVFNIKSPPLRERKNDILLLANAFIKKYKTKMGFSHDIKLSNPASAILMAYEWPGNIRELENIIERGVILCHDGIIGIEHLPVEISDQAKQNIRPQFVDENNLECQVANFEREIIENALESANGNKAKAARILKISERTFWNKLKKYNISTA